MVAGLLGGVCIVAVAALLYAAGLALVRTRYGQRGQQAYNAVALLVFALVLDAMVLLQSVWFSTDAVGRFLQIRGEGSQNPLVQETLSRLQVRDLSLGALLGTVLPIATWVLAHIAVVAAAYLARSVLTVLPQAERQGGPASRPPTALWLRPLVSSCLVLAVFAPSFRFCASLEVYLLRCYVIKNSRVLVESVGADWEKLSTQELDGRLRGSVSGEVVRHVGGAYVIFVLLAAAVMAVACHWILSVARTLPRRPYRTEPPPLDPPDIPPLRLEPPRPPPPVGQPDAGGDDGGATADLGWDAPGPRG